MCVPSSFIDIYLAFIVFLKDIVLDCVPQFTSEFWRTSVSSVLWWSFTLDTSQTVLWRGQTRAWRVTLLMCLCSTSCFKEFILGLGQLCQPLAFLHRHGVISHHSLRRISFSTVWELEGGHSAITFWTRVSCGSITRTISTKPGRAQGDARWGVLLWFSSMVYVLLFCPVLVVCQFTSVMATLAVGEQSIGHLKSLPFTHKCQIVPVPSAFVSAFEK